MKKIILLIAILLIASCTGTKKNKLKDGIISSLPESVDFVLAVDSIKDVFDNLMLSEDSVLGNKFSKWDKRGIEEVNGILGFNYLNIKNWEQTGVDLDKLAGFSIDVAKIDIKKKEYCYNQNIYDNETGKITGSDKKCNSYDSQDAIVNFALFIPVKDSKLFLKRVNETAKSDFVTISKEKGITKIILGKKTDKYHLATYLLKRGDYFIWVMTLSDELKIDTALSFINSKKSLSDNVSYRVTRKKISTSKGLYLLANINGFIKKHEAFFNKQLSKSHRGEEKFIISNFIKLFKGYKFVASSIEFKNPELKVNFFAELTDNSLMKKVYNGVLYDKKYILGISDKIVSELSIGANTNTIYKAIKKTFLKNKLESTVSKISMISGLNFQKDFIDQLAGNFNLGVYNAETINPMNHNFVASFTVKDSKLFSKTLAKLSDKFNNFMSSKKVGDSIFYTLTTPMMIKLYFTLKGKSFIFSTSKTYFDKALAVKNIKDGEIFKIVKKNKVKNSINGDNFFYLDFYELSKVLEIFRINNKIIPKFDSITISSSLKNNNFSGTFLLKVNSEKPFFKFLAELFGNK